MDNGVELCYHTKMSKLQGTNNAKEEYIGEGIKKKIQKIYKMKLMEKTY